MTIEHKADPVQSAGGGGPIAEKGNAETWVPHCKHCGHAICRIDLLPPEGPEMKGMHGWLHVQFGVHCPPPAHLSADQVVQALAAGFDQRATHAEPDDSPASQQLQRIVAWAESLERELKLARAGAAGAARLDLLVVVERLRLIREAIAIRRDEITGANAFVHREGLREVDNLVKQLQNELRAEPRAAGAALAPLVEEIGRNFRMFGGGRDSQFNPLAHMLRSDQLTFAAGVSVKDVVRFVLERAARAGDPARLADSETKNDEDNQSRVGPLKAGADRQELPRRD